MIVSAMLNRVCLCGDVFEPRVSPVGKATETCGRAVCEAELAHIKEQRRFVSGEMFARYLAQRSQSILINPTLRVQA